MTERVKCITFDKEAQDSLPAEIKDRMKVDRAKAEAEQKQNKDQRYSVADLDDILLHLTDDERESCFPCDVYGRYYVPNDLYKTLKERIKESAKEFYRVLKDTNSNP